MKTLVLAGALGTFLLGNAAWAKTAALDTSAVQPPDVSGPEQTRAASPASDRLRLANPTGLPAYEMRTNGLLINGLLPANGWQG